VERAKIGQLKNQLSRYLDRVREGTDVIVYDRDQPVARLTPIGRRADASNDGDEARLASLERRGLIRRATMTRPAKSRLAPPARVEGGVLRALRADRETDW